MQGRSGGPGDPLPGAAREGAASGAMVTWLQLLLIGIAANLDNLGVGMALGAGAIHVPAGANLVVALEAFLFTVLSASAGHFVRGLVRASVASTAGALLLIAMGVYFMAAEHRAAPRQSPILGLLREPHRADLDRSGSIGLAEGLLLGTALGLNCLANGFVAGLWHLGALPTAFVTALFSYLALWGGDRLATHYAARWLGIRGPLVAGALLVLLGLRQLL
ncbi:hypothetical protein U7230_13250 [Carboxydochorda subterranea]|uniref:Sporulation protein YtaF n=1 Tax=Carboxydichorda subterranea TaxID=3109565 RepID=A0ABZ1BW53_9FIRM|nr:hypothetical protein [Limnochorda sp. L945t]WRP17037.1 hypothetical protein U7230_13250 [Limnochorda sp. L945t]